MRDDDGWWLRFLLDVGKVVLGLAVVSFLMVTCAPPAKRLAESMTKYLEVRAASILAADACKGKEGKR